MSFSFMSERLMLSFRITGEWFHGKGGWLFGFWETVQQINTFY